MQKIETILFFAPIVYVIPASLGYLALLTDNDLLVRWSLGILGVLVLISIGAIAVVIVKRKEKEKENEK